MSLTLEELEAKVTELTEQVNTLLNEAKYQLRYSGEEIDGICDKVTQISARPTDINHVTTKFKNTKYGASELQAAYEKVMPMPSASDINTLYSALYNKRFKWGTISTNVNYNGGQSWSWAGIELIPSGATNVAVFASCDWGGAKVLGGTVSYSISGQKIAFTCLFHEMFNGVSQGTKKTTLYYLIAYNV